MTEGKIKKDGSLYIKRRGKWIVCRCKDSGGFCNHGCALFLEPIICKNMYRNYYNENPAEHYTRLPLCHTIWEFDKFEDLREKGND